MSNTGPAELLKELAPLATEGARSVLVLGKVKGQKRAASQTTGEVTIKSEVICGEGDTITLKQPATATVVPPIGHIGAFLIDRPTEYQNKASANLLAFA